MSTRPNPDRVLLGVILAAGVMLSAGSVIVSGGAAIPWWPLRIVTGGLAAALTAAAALLGLARITSVTETRPLLFRSVACVAPGVAALALPSPTTTWFCYIGMGFAGAVTMPARRIPLLALVPCLAFLTHLWLTRGDGTTLALNLGTVVVLVVYLVMRRRRAEAEDLAAAQRLVISLDRERLESAERQRASAAQLHDVLAHTLSGLIVTLQGASALAAKESVSPNLSERLSVATDLARDGLHGAREAVELLYREADAAAPLAPWLQQTIERLTATTPMRVTVQGDPSSVPTAAGRMARSVLMEGLTNALRHAPGAEVTISFLPGALRLSTIERETADLAHPSGRHGLIGLAERAAAQGFTFTFGPTEQGFALELTWERT